MLLQIPLLTGLGFAALYPLCFWMNADNPLRNNFHHFHMGCPVIIGGLSVFGVIYQSFPIWVLALCVTWLILGLILTALYWNKETVALVPITLLSCIGVLAFVAVYTQWITSDPIDIAMRLIGVAVLTAAFYAMNLGHFYLNVHGLDVNYLRRAVNLFSAVLALRLVLDGILIFFRTVMVNGYDVTYAQYLFSFEGIFLLVAILFGTIFPLVGNYFVMETVKLKNTQSATGILYVLLSALLLGEGCYQFYALQHHVVL